MALRARTWSLLATSTLLGITWLALCPRWPIRRYEIAEPSMSPELRPGDYVVTTRPKNLGRGMVVVFEHPHQAGFHLAKRVVGLPGEEVAMVDGQVRIDGAPLLESWSPSHDVEGGRWDVAEDHAFVLGDQRAWSRADSRDIGQIPVEQLSQVVFRYWPPARVGFVRSP